MSLIDTLKDLFSKKDSPKKEEPAKPEGDKPLKPMQTASFIDGNHGLIPGIKKNWVTGTVAVFGGIFIIALFMAMSSDDKKQPSNTSTINFTSSQASDKKKSTSSANQVARTADDYSEKAQRDAERDLMARDAKNGQQPKAEPPKTAMPAPAAPAAPQIDPNALAAAAKSAAETKARYASNIEMLKGTSSNGISNGQSSNSNSNSSGAGFSSQTSGQRQGVNNVTPAYTSADNNTIVSGTIFPVMLLTGINTDAPGRVLAQIQTNVYDFNHTRVIIPSGSKLLGSYEASSATNGRLSLTFTALQLPDGGTYDIGDSIIAIDGEGYMGVAGKTHRHTARKISGGVIASAIAALGSVAAGNTSSSRESYTAGQLAAQGALGNLISATSGMINSDSSGIKPTVTVEPGHQFNVYVVNNMIFEQR